VKDLLSIKEFSKLSGLETSTLRYWDDIGLFAPEQRDPHNDYRYYSPWQIITVNFVTVLRNLGIPVKKISKVGNERCPNNIIDLIDQQEDLLDKEIRKLQDARSVIRTRRALIKRGQEVNPLEISVRELPEFSLILGPPNDDFAGHESFYLPFVNFCNHAEELNINLNYPIGSYHPTIEGFFDHPSKPDYFFSLDPDGNSKREAGEYLVGYTLGYYGDFGDLPQQMANYAEENGLILEGPVYVIYLHDEICIKDPNYYLSQTSIALSRK